MHNLLVLMIDCLRHDRLHGPRKSALTPNLDRLVERAASFENVHAVGSNTTAVMGSWLTGLYPFRHGLRSFRDRKFTGRPTTMASLLRDAGYRTAATVTEALADAEDLLDGFSEIERRNKKKEAIHDGYGERVRQKIAELNRGAEPWLYFVHTCELHPDRQCAEPFRRSRYGRDFYDRCLSSLDHHLGPILEAIDWQRTLVVVFGDHGDNLLWEPRGERASKVMNRLRGDGRVSALWWLRDLFCKAGLYGPWKAILRRNFLFHHDYHLYRFLTHAPLLILPPGRDEGRRFAAPMSTVDALPTLLDLIGVPLAQPVDGASFAPLLRGEVMAAPERPLYQEVVTDFVLKGRDPSKLRIPLLRGLVEGDWKLVDSPLDHSIRPELYDLAADPEERRNLYPRRRSDARVAAMRRRLEQLTGDSEAARAAPGLAALGAAA
jgi:arylsulfatase A-like enzyme